MNTDQNIQVALVGYGMAGRVFHAPLLAGVPGLRLHTVVSSKPEAVRADWPDVTVVAALEHALANPAIDLVLIATGNESHYPLAKQALLAGKHVVVDKPCTVTLAQTDDLLDTARAQGKVLTVFQNRRWDADFLALRRVMESGELGRIVHFESHFDRYRPTVPDRWREQDLPGSGLWFDLGAHLVDQCLQLFGAPDDLMVDLANQREGASVNDYFHAQLRYPSAHPGLRVVLHAGALVPAVGPRFVVHGTRGSFVKYGLDVQEDALKAGGRPQWGATSDWGWDPLPANVTVHSATGAETRTEAANQGNYLAYYAHLHDHLRGYSRGQLPGHSLGGWGGVAATGIVSPAEVRRAMQLLTLGAQSAAEGRFVAVPR